MEDKLISFLRAPRQDHHLGKVWIWQLGIVREPETRSTATDNTCLGTLFELPDDDKIADRLLHHTDQVFRLSYILGSFTTVDEADDGWAYEGESDTDSDERTFLNQQFRRSRRQSSKLF
jgi:hypothetical protein